DNRGATSTSSPIQVTVGVRPTVTITSPPSPQTILALGSNFTLSASASDSDGTVTKVEFFNGGQLLATVNAPPYTYNWQNIPLGSYAISAVATDNQGLTSNPGTPRIINVIEPPTVAITSPANNTVFASPANVTLVAQSSAPGDTILQVEFYQGTTLVDTVFF